MGKAGYKVIWGVGALVVLCGVCGVGGYTGFGQPERQYRQELAKSEAVGLPSDLQKYQRQVDPDVNAAGLYLEAITAWSALEKSDHPVSKALLAGMGPNGLAPDYDVNTAERDLVKAEPVLKKLDAAAALPDLCFDKRYSDGMYALFPELAPMRNFVKLRCLRALVFANRGKFDDAYAELARAGTISRQLGQDNPTLIGLLVQIAGRAITLRGLEQVLCIQGRNPIVVANADLVLKSLGDPPNLHRALRGEYASSLGTMQLLADPKRREDMMKMSTGNFGEDSPRTPTVEERLVGWPSVRYQMMASLVKFYRRVYTELPEATPSGTKLLKAAKAVDARQEDAVGPTDFLTRSLMPVFAGAAGAVVKDVANVRLMKLLALNLSRRQGIEIPTDFPNDPFSDKPFLGKVTADGFRLWSVGRNGIDDGGILKGNNDADGDTVVGFPYVDKSVRQRSAIGAAAAARPAL